MQALSIMHQQNKEDGVLAVGLAKINAGSREFNIYIFSNHSFRLPQFILKAKEGSNVFFCVIHDRESPGVKLLQLKHQQAFSTYISHLYFISFRYGL